MAKLLVTVLFVSTLFIRANAQAVITRINNIVYIESSASQQAQQQKLAMLCNQYVQQHYTKGEAPLVLLDIQQSTASPCYQLGYDNIYGTSINNEIYKPQTSDHTNLGIRIKICDKAISEQTVLKLLQYGLEHLYKLKQDRENMLKLDFYDRADNITVNKKTINRIINKKASPEIETMVNNFQSESIMTASSK